MKYCIFTLTIFSIFFFGCDKKDKLTPPVKFKNDTQVPLTVSIYYSQADYFEEVSPVTTLSIAPGAEAEAEGDLFENGRFYYYDVHSDDYRICNWGIDEYYALPFDTPMTSHIRFEYPAKEIIKCGGNPDRIVFLGAGAVSAKWVAVDAVIEGGSSVWDKLTANEKALSFVINKDYTAILSETDANRVSINIHLRFDGLSLYDIGITDRRYYMGLMPINAGYYPALSPGKIYLENIDYNVEYIYVMKLQ